MQLSADIEAAAGDVRRLFENGYRPIPLRAGEKAHFPSWVIRRPNVAGFLDAYRFEKKPPNIGFRLEGHVAVDIDEVDRNLAHLVRANAEQIFGTTPLVRLGNRMKGGALLYRADKGLAGWKIGPIEFKTGRGQFLAVGGIHPSGASYVFEDGSPLDLHSDELPLVTAEKAERFRRLLSSLYGEDPKAETQRRPRSGPLADGRREALRAFIAAEIGRQMRDGDPDYQSVLSAALLWFFDPANINLRKGKGDSARPWTEADVEREVRYSFQPARLSKLQPARSRRTWTWNLKLALLREIHADPKTTDSHVKVAAALINAHRGDDDAAGERRKRHGGLSSSTIAEQTGLRDDHVRRLRRDLIKWGYFDEKAPGYRRPKNATATRGKAPVLVPADSWLGMLRVPQTFSDEDLRRAQAVEAMSDSDEDVSGPYTGIPYEEEALKRENIDRGSMIRLVGEPCGDHRFPDLADRWPNLFERHGDGAVRIIGDRNALGAELARLRERRGLSQAEIARRAGLVPSRLVAIERGEAGDGTAVMKLVRALSAAAA